MEGAGPGPQGSGPAPLEEGELARRLLYARSAPPPARALEPLGAEPPDDAPPTASVAAVPRRRAGGRMRVVVVGLAVVAAVALPFGVGTVLRPGPAAQLPIPALSGESIAAYVRTHDSSVGPTAVTYQPEGYTVHQPAGRVVHIAFRCRGAGTVVLAAGDVERFRCTGRERLFLRSDGRRRTAPFTVTATTTGDVVWAVRVTLRVR